MKYIHKELIALCLMAGWVLFFNNRLLEGIMMLFAFGLFVRVRKLLKEGGIEDNGKIFG